MLVDGSPALDLMNGTVPQLLDFYGQVMLDLAGPPEAVSGEPEAAEVPKAGGSLVSLGAGSGSKAAAMYLAKYALKQSAEISASCAVLIDAQAHIKEFASVAEDAEVPEAGGAVVTPFAV